MDEKILNKMETWLIIYLYQSNLLSSISLNDRQTKSPLWTFNRQAQKVFWQIYDKAIQQFSSLQCSIAVILSFPTLYNKLDTNCFNIPSYKFPTPIVQLATQSLPSISQLFLLCKQPLFILSFYLSMYLTVSIILACILAILPSADSLFKLVPDTSLTPQNLTNPSNIILDHSGSKFFIYNNESSFRIYDTNGSMQCESFFDSQITRVIWPSNYHPMVVTFPGMQLYKLSENDCTVIQNYTFATNALEMTFAWRDDLPVLAVTLQLFIQEYNANTFAKLRTISSNMVVFKLANALYSQDSLTLYASEITMLGSRRVQVFNTQAGGTIGNISLNNSINGMSLMKDGKNIVLFETNLLDFETNVYAIYANGTSSYLFGRQNVRKMLGLWTANVVVNFKANSMTFEVIKIDNKSSIQNLSYSTNPSLTTMIDFDLQNDTIAILDSYGVVTIGSYQPDKQPDPEPEPQPEKEKGGMEVWIFAVIGGGALLLIVGLVIVCRKRLKCFKKCLKSQQKDTETQKDSVITSEVKKAQRKQSQQSQKQIDEAKIDSKPLLQDQISQEQRQIQLQRQRQWQLEQQRLWKQQQQRKLREQVEAQLLLLKQKKENQEREKKEKQAQQERLRQNLEKLEEMRKKKERQDWEKRNRVQGDEYQQQQGSSSNLHIHNKIPNQNNMFGQYDRNDQLNNRKDQFNDNNRYNSHLNIGHQYQNPQQRGPNLSNLSNYQNQPYDYNNKPPQYNGPFNGFSSNPSSYHNPSSSSFSHSNLSQSSSHYNHPNKSLHMNIPPQYNQPQYNPSKLNPPQYPYSKTPSSSSFSHNILPTNQNDLSYPFHQIPLHQEEQSLTGYENYSQKVNLENQSRFNSKKQSKHLPEYQKPLTQKPEMDELVFQRNNLFNNKSNQKFSENPIISEPQQKTLSESHMVIDKNNKIDSKNADV